MSGRRFTPVYPALLILILALVYSNALHGPFVMDDDMSIVNNTAIRQLWPLTKALNPPPADVTFFNRPFINLTMCVNYALGGLNPFGYRLFSLFMHIAAALALFGLMRRTLEPMRYEPEHARRLGFASALLWGVHPLLTSAVNYQSQRSEVGMGLFLFLMLYCLNRAITQGAEAGAPPVTGPVSGEGGPAASRAVGWLLASVFFCLLGMGSKESMAAAPILALAYDRIFLCGSWREMLEQRRDYYLLLAMTWLWPLFRHLAYSQYMPDLGIPWEDIWRYLLTQAWGLVRMLRLVLWPAPLIFYYGTQLVGRFSEVWWQSAALAVLLGATVWALFRRPRLGFLGLVFFAVLAPSSSIIPITGQPIAEHRMYAPLAVFAPLAAWALDWMARRGAGIWRGWAVRPLFFVLLAGWAMALGVATHRHNRVFADEWTLCRDIMRKRPQNWRAHTEYARLLRSAGRLQEAEDHLVSLLANPPKSPGDLIYMGSALTYCHRLEEAVTCYREALKLRPHMAVVQNMLGNVLVDLGREAEAEQAFRDALALRPTYAEAHYNLANLLFYSERYPEALAHYKMAVKGRPEVALNWYNLGVTHAQLNEFDEAERCVRIALSLDAALPDAAATLQRIQAARGN